MFDGDRDTMHKIFVVYIISGLIYVVPLCCRADR
jgi:hypothetical protein